MARRPSGVMRTGSSARYRAPVRIQRPSAVSHPPASRTLKQPSMSRWPGAPAVIAPVPRQTRPIDDALQRLLDEQAIRRLLVDYCRGVDRGDEALVASVYHPDATDDHGRFKGTGLDFAAYAVPRLTRAVRGHDALDHQHGGRLRRP